MKITNEILEGYLNCKTKGHLKLAGESGTQSDYEAMTTAAGRASRETAIAKLVSRFGERNACQGIAITAATLKQRAPLLVDATLEDDELSLRLDALRRADGASMLGEHHYLPVLHNHGDKVGCHQKLLLAVFGLVLDRVQGRRPDVGWVARGREARLGKVRLDAKLYRQAKQVLGEVKRFQSGGERPWLALNEHCRKCEFRDRCHAEAVEKDDISLLRVMSYAELRKHRNKGIFTVTQLAYTYRPRRKGRRTRGESPPHHAALQALAIRDGKTYVLGKPEVPHRPIRVYLDLEGDTDGAGVYLLGALVVKDGIGTMRSFWADEPDGEGWLLARLLEVVGEEDFDLLHFGSYERRFLQRMRGTAKRKGPVNRLLANAVDVLSLVRSNVYFPVHANGLKEIAKHLGFDWSHPEASGLQSLVWRRRWEEGRNDSFKQRLVAYNAEDCAALRLVAEHLQAIATTYDGEAAASGPGAVESVKATTRGSDFRKWGHTTFLLPEFERASKCAWFDYQRERIVARRPGGKAKARPVARKKAKPTRPTRRVVVRSNRCPGCKSRNVCASRGPMNTRFFLDLKVSESGVRRVVVKYVAAKHRCRDCGRYFLPRKFKKLERFGHSLKCWAVYQHVANRTSFESLSRTLQEFYGLVISFNDLYRFKLDLARRYKLTYVGLLEKIVAGNLLHADETSIQFKKDKGYVWAFTNLENVVYMCRPTREVDFLAPLLMGFSGVLVSDFYKGYDSMPCPQQKCLVHLIRDLNGDLEIHFHDEAFKGLAKAFGALLEQVVATIDRHGLRRERLQRHKADVDKFFEEACGELFQSEVAEGYRKRFLKYRDKLFTFLDHDGVPWHNNNSEHAIKHFAKYRMITNGKVTANGLQPYLVLLSIYQTCVYKKVSFFRFLLSEQKDVDAFVGTKRKQRCAVVCRPNSNQESVGDQEVRTEAVADELAIEEPA